ncbi:MAG: hypothetical protein E7F64_05320, partial [Clostridiales bacterium]|nr:hypothetical protein [Clostridiales bacterium]
GQIIVTAMPKRRAATALPITGTCLPMNQEGIAIARVSKIPGPFFLRNIIQNFLSIDYFVPVSLYSKSDKIKL